MIAIFAHEIKARYWFDSSTIGWLILCFKLPFLLFLLLVTHPDIYASYCNNDSQVVWDCALLEKSKSYYDRFATSKLDMCVYRLVIWLYIATVLLYWLPWFNTTCSAARLPLRFIYPYIRYVFFEKKHLLNDCNMSV